MVRVSKRPCIRALAGKSFQASRGRNCIAVLAIILTSILLTALFTVGLSINEAFQQSNFRQVGGYAHGGFKGMSEEQYLKLCDDPLIKPEVSAGWLVWPQGTPCVKIMWRCAGLIHRTPSGCDLSPFRVGSPRRRPQIWQTEECSVLCRPTFWTGSRFMGAISAR